MTLKFSISFNDEDRPLMLTYQRQFSSALRSCYNYIFRNPSKSAFELNKKDSGIQAMLDSMSNIDLVKSNSYLRLCIISKAKSIYDAQKDKAKKIVFGKKANFVKRCKGVISNEEWKSSRLNPIFIVGSAKPYKGNRFVRINQDLSGFSFSPNRKTTLNMQINGSYRHYKKLLNALYILQENKSIPITYHISSSELTLYFDETFLKKEDLKCVKNRVMAIDMNPNYVGWSIADWSGSTENDFKVIKSGVISIKKLNDKDKEFKGKHLAPDSKERTYISNKRIHETLEISKKLVSIALHYRCQLFAVEELSMKASDKGLGKNFNKLVNNMWCRNALVNNLRKRCNIFGIKLLEVKPEYSSFIGNFLFRSLNLPDMVLASIEIGRRGFELYNQYTTKKNKIRKNIIQPSKQDFYNFYAASMEEFGLEDEKELNLVGVYYYLKNSKRMYRVPLEEWVKHSNEVFRVLSTKKSSICFI